MKNAHLITVMAFLLAVQVANADFNIPLTSDSWDLFGWPAPGRTDYNPILTQAPDGIQFSGSGYRGNSVLETKAQWDLTNATVYLKWQANGAGTFMAISPIFYPQNEYEYEYDSINYNVGSFSTGNQYGSTTLISENTWYYSRITFDAVNGAFGVTATQNYDNHGGAIVQSYSRYGPFSQTDLDNLQHLHLGLGLSDMYAGTSAWAKIGEAYVVTPEPATLLLLTLGGLALRKRK
jgi:hypothetical protein